MSKTERALRGPGLIEITLGVLLSLVLGVVLATAHLMAKQVEVVKELPKEGAVPGQIYMIEGSANGAKAKQWTRKRQILMEGKAAVVTFNEDELNAWIASLGLEKTSMFAKYESFKPGIPNIRIRDGRLHLGMTSEFQGEKDGMKMVVQFRGYFEKQGDEYAFMMDELYMNSLPMHRLWGGAAIPYKLSEAGDLPEEVLTMWKRLSLVAIEGDALKLVVP